MDLHTFDKISTNDDVMIHIFNRLPFGDQLALAGTSSRMKNLFENYIWTQKYSTLKISGYSTSKCFVVTNKTNINRKCLSAEQLKEFLKFYAIQTQELKLFKDNIEMDLGQFKNLTNLSYLWTYESQKPDKQLQLIAKNVPNLECLEIYIQKKHYLEDVEVTLDVKQFLKMKNLKSLGLLIDSFVLGQISVRGRDVYEIMTKLKLVYFQCNIPINIPMAIIEVGKIDLTVPSQHLQELVICLDFNWSTPDVSFIGNFEHLTILKIRIVGPITEEFLTKLAENCRNLKKLYIDGERFENIKSFRLASKVTDLNLGNTSGLTYENLRQLLTETRLTKFCHTALIDEGVSDDFILSPLIQELELRIDNIILKSISEGNTNLKKLTWHPVFTSKGTFTSVVFFSNLETLHIGGCPIKLDTILQLKNLHNLSMVLPDEDTASFIIGLLKHQPLTTLKLSIGHGHHDLNMLEGDFTTNITNLKINYRIFKLCLDFWLDLFCHNNQMCLECNELRREDDDFLRELVKSKRFPKSLKTIDVIGFTISCNDFRSPHNRTLQNLIEDQEVTDEILDDIWNNVNRRDFRLYGRGAHEYQVMPSRITSSRITSLENVRFYKHIHLPRSTQLFRLLLGNGFG